MTESSGASPDGTKNNSAAGGGGAVFCSFATPNLSFWKLLALPDGQVRRAKLSRHTTTHTRAYPSGDCS
jgi:hypothetical protein